MSLQTLSYRQANELVNQSPDQVRIFAARCRAEEFSDGYRIRDANRRVPAYVIAGEQIAGATLKELTREEAGRIASLFAALPDLVEPPLDHQPQWFWWKWLGLTMGAVGVGRTAKSPKIMTTQTTAE
jgi:hypothetical protein